MYLRGHRLDIKRGYFLNEGGKHPHMLIYYLDLFNLGKNCNDQSSIPTYDKMMSEQQKKQMVIP
jgi:hypothetical protein